jgi:hypothetical protein
MHWFDRLTERSTRREALKATAAAGVALALPLDRAARARAADIPKCTKGCLWTAGEKYVSTVNGCASTLGIGGYTGLFAGGFFPLAGSYFAAMTCLDHANTTNQLAAWNCKQPSTCGGFDPTQSGGPCDGCTENCCTCQGTTSGYICCFYPCDGPTTCCPSG